MEPHPVKVLVVEDSEVERAMLLHIFQADPEIEVVSIATNGEEAVEAVCRYLPDVVTMDIHLPKMDGLEATRRIMQRCPVPIVIISSSAAYDPEGEKAFRALKAGALALGRRPPGIGHPDYAAEVQALLQTLKLMSEVKVVRQRPPAAFGSPTLPKVEAALPVEVVAIGASAGGPQALFEVLSGLPKDLPVPVLIVQHMTPGFIHGFALWLQEATGFPVAVAAHGERIQPGHAYLAPDGVHMGVANDGRIALCDDAPKEGLRPSVAHLFHSVGNIFGESAVAVLLSGMGNDGAAELKALKDRGAITLVQDRDSSMIYGMPGEAVKLGGACHILPLQRIAVVLAELARKGNRHG